MARRKNKKKSKARQFLDISTKRTVDTIFISDQHQAEEVVHQKRICDLENAILSKTIFVTSNVKDLNN
jgi:hypothetical protein